MNAHLIDNNGQVTVASVAAFPKQPLIVSRAGKTYANHDPGFAFFDGIPYMDYREAAPQPV